MLEVEKSCGFSLGPLDLSMSEAGRLYMEEPKYSFPEAPCTDSPLQRFSEHFHEHQVNWGQHISGQAGALAWRLVSSESKALHQEDSLLTLRVVKDTSPESEKKRNTEQEPLVLSSQFSEKYATTQYHEIEHAEDCVAGSDLNLGAGSDKEKGSRLISTEKIHIIQQNNKEIFSRNEEEDHVSELFPNEKILSKAGCSADTFYSWKAVKRISSASCADCERKAENFSEPHEDVTPRSICEPGKYNGSVPFVMEDGHIESQGLEAGAAANRTKQYKSHDSKLLTSKATLKRNVTDNNRLVNKSLSKKDKKRREANEKNSSRRVRSEGDDNDESISANTVSNARKLLGWLSKVEQDFGSFIFMIVYFGIYSYLHGFSYRLILIGTILIMQGFYQTPCMSLFWAACSRFFSSFSLSGSSAAVQGSSLGRERKILRGKPEKRNRRLPGAFWVMSLSCAMLTSNLLYERYSVPTPPQITVPVETARGVVNLSVQIKASSPKRSEADRLCEEAQIAEALRAWPEVESKLLLAIKLDSSHVCSLYNYARLLDYVWHKSELANEMYQRALASNPKHVPSLRNFGYFQYYVRKNFLRAEEIWKLAIREQPNEVDVLSGYGMLKYQIRGDWMQGERLFREAIRVNPAHVPSLLHLASLLRFARKNEAEARKVYGAVLRLVPNHIGAMLEYAAMVYDSAEPQRGDAARSIKQAADLWGRVLKLSPNNIEALFFLGRSGYREGRVRLYRECAA